MSAAQHEPLDHAAAMFRRCAACGAADGLYLPPWARTAELVWNALPVDENGPRVGIAFCAFCKTPATYAVPTTGDRATRDAEQ